MTGLPPRVDDGGRRRTWRTDGRRASLSANESRPHRPVSRLRRVGRPERAAQRNSGIKLSTNRMQGLYIHVLRCDTGPIGGSLLSGPSAHDISQHTTSTDDSISKHVEILEALEVAHNI